MKQRLAAGPFAASAVPGGQVRLERRCRVPRGVNTADIASETLVPQVGSALGAGPVCCGCKLEASTTRYTLQPWLQARGVNNAHG